MLAGLGHRAVGRRHDQDRAVHLRGAGDHVLDVVGVARAVDVRVVPIRRRVLDVARRDRQNLRRIAAALRLGRLRDLVVRDELWPSPCRRRPWSAPPSEWSCHDRCDRWCRRLRVALNDQIFLSTCLRSLAFKKASPDVVSIRSTFHLRAFGATVDKSPARSPADTPAGLPSEARVEASERRMEPMTRIELVTSSLPRTRSAN